MRNGATREHRKREADDADLGEDMLAGKSADQIRERVSEWAGIVRRETQKRPGRSAAIALGAGYLLGGGLFSALTARIVGVGLRVGLRLALLPFVAQSLVAIGERVARGGIGSRGEADQDESNERPTKHQKRNPEEKETHP